MMNIQTVFGRIAFFLLVVPFIELYLLFALGSAIGATPVIAWVIVSGVIGVNLARRQGTSILYSWRSKLEAGEMPEQGLLHGALLFLGALLLVIPGLVSDVVGMLLLVSPARTKLASYVYKKIEARSNLQSNIHIQQSTVIFQDDIQVTQASGPWTFLDRSNPTMSTESQNSRPRIIDAEIVDDSNSQGDASEHASDRSKN